VIVLASAGDQAPVRWSLLPATDSAGGDVLLAYRESWHDDQRPDDENTARLDLEARASEVRRDGHAVQAHGDITSLAVPVPMVPTPLAALVLSGHTRALSDADREALLTALRRSAARLGDSYHWRRRSPSTREMPTTLPITAKDRQAGWIRVPNTAKRVFPPDTADTVIRLRGTTLRAQWNARRGPPEHSGTLYIGRHMLDGLVDTNEILTRHRQGRPHRAELMDAGMAHCARCPSPPPVVIHAFEPSCMKSRTRQSWPVPGSQDWAEQRRGGGGPAHPPPPRE